MEKTMAESALKAERPFLFTLILLHAHKSRARVGGPEQSSATELDGPVFFEFSLRDSDKFPQLIQIAKDVHIIRQSLQV